MKHAILIMAHKEFGHLYHLVEYFDKNCDVFIHIDVKSEFTDTEVEKLKALAQVKAVYRKFSVHWGGFSILRCEMFMLRDAMAQCDAEYFHLISGQDYPVRPLEHFFEFFEKNNGFNFIQYVHLPHPRWERNTFTRFRYFYIYDWIKNGKKSYGLVKKLVDLQKRFSIKRRIPDFFNHLYGNSQWFSINRNAVMGLIEYTDKHPALYRRMRMTFAPEESYVATVLVNLENGKNIIPNNYRFIRWKYENGSSPANLCDKHFHLLMEKPYLFARKFESPYCKQLVKMIDKYLINGQQEIHVTDNGGWVYDGFLKYTYEEQFVDAVMHIEKYTKIDAVLDMGCGSGAYVAALRERGIAVVGYDANPYTEKLSGYLLKENDELCGQADLTDDLEIESGFDLVICKDVLPYIPDGLEMKAIENLAKLSSKYILISWYTNEENVEGHIRCRQEEDVIELFEHYGFCINAVLSAQIREIMKKGNSNLYYLFENKNV